MQIKQKISIFGCIIIEISNFYLFSVCVYVPCKLLLFRTNRNNPTVYVKAQNWPAYCVLCVPVMKNATRIEKKNPKGKIINSWDWLGFLQRNSCQIHHRRRSHHRYTIRHPLLEWHPVHLHLRPERLKLPVQLSSAPLSTAFTASCKKSNNKNNKKFWKN